MKNKLKYTAWTANGIRVDASGSIVACTADLYGFFSVDQRKKFKEMIAEEDKRLAAREAVREVTPS